MFLKEDANLEKSRYKFNLFDIVVIVVILAVAFLGYKYLNREILLAHFKERRATYAH